MKARKKQFIGLLSEFLSGKRLTHSVNVANNAENLARQYAPEIADKAWIAGLLHDHAKKMKPRQLIQTANDYDIGVGMLEIEEPSLLHGKVGAALLKDRFDEDDVEIFQAIADHVTGRKNMGMLSKILFVADQIAEDRDFVGVDMLRDTAKFDLDQAVLIAAKNKLVNVLSLGKALLPETVDLYNSLLGNN